MMNVLQIPLEITKGLTALFMDVALMPTRLPIFVDTLLKELNNIGYTGRDENAPHPLGLRLVGLSLGGVFSVAVGLAAAAPLIALGSPIIVGLAIGLWGGNSLLVGSVGRAKSFPLTSKYVEHIQDMELTPPPFFR